MQQKFLVLKNILSLIQFRGNSLDQFLVTVAVLCGKVGKILERFGKNFENFVERFFLKKFKHNIPVPRDAVYGIMSVCH